MTSATRSFQVHPAWLIRVFGVGIVGLALAHLVLHSIKHLGLPTNHSLMRLFDLGSEANLPTFFSSFQLLVVAALLTVIGASRRSEGDAYSRHWLFLALLTFLLAIDEASQIHEIAIRPVRRLAPWLPVGVFHNAWVLPGAALVLAVTFSYAGFVFRYLPRETRNATILGAAIFVGGAIGVEIPEGSFAREYGFQNLTFPLFVLVEETMEMTGVLIFLSGLLEYCRKYLGSFHLTVASP